MSRKVKTYIYNISCGIDSHMMKDIEKHMKINNCSRSKAIRHILQAGINTFDKSLKELEEVLK